MTALPNETIYIHTCPVCTYPVVGGETQNDTTNLVAHISSNHTNQ